MSMDRTCVPWGWVGEGGFRVHRLLEHRLFPSFVPGPQQHLPPAYREMRGQNPATITLTSCVHVIAHYKGLILKTR